MLVSIPLSLSLLQYIYMLESMHKVDDELSPKLQSRCFVINMGCHMIDRIHVDLFEVGWIRKRVILRPESLVIML